MENKTRLRKTKRQPAGRPGRPVRGSTTGRPLMAALDLLGRRWSLRILWELREGPLGARSLRERCDGMSPSVLYDRLGELTGAGLGVRALPSHGGKEKRKRDQKAGKKAARKEQPGPPQATPIAVDDGKHR